MLMVLVNTSFPIIITSFIYLLMLDLKFLSVSQNLVKDPTH